MKEIKFDGVLNFETSPAVMAFPKELREDALTENLFVYRKIGIKNT